MTRHKNDIHTINILQYLLIITIILLGLSVFVNMIFITHPDCVTIYNWYNVPTVEYKGKDYKLVPIEINRKTTIILKEK